MFETSLSSFILVIVVSFPAVVLLPNVASCTGSLQAAGVTTIFVLGLVPMSILILAVLCIVPCCGINGAVEGMVGSGKHLNGGDVCGWCGICV